MVSIIKIPFNIFRDVWIKGQIDLSYYEVLDIIQQFDSSIYDVLDYTFSPKDLEIIFAVRRREY